MEGDSTKQAQLTPIERLKSDLGQVLQFGVKSDVNALIEILSYFLGFR